MNLRTRVTLLSAVTAALAGAGLGACVSGNLPPQQQATPDGSAATDGSIVPEGASAIDSGAEGSTSMADAPTGIGANDAGAVDPYFSNVVLLMHFDGANGGTTFTDVKGHVVMTNGAAQLSTAQSALGGASGYFDGTSAYLTMTPSDDWNFNASDFTVELFVYFNGPIASQRPIPTFAGYWGPTSQDGAWEFCYNVNYSAAQGANDQTPGTVYIVFSTAGTDEVLPAVPWAPAANTWYHLAAVRHGSDFLYFVNGTLVGSQTLGSGVADWYRLNPASNAGTWLTDGGVSANAAIHPKSLGPFSIGVGIGQPGAPNPDSYFSGYIDEARITKGVARYTANFTPPTQEFPNQ